MKISLAMMMLLLASLSAVMTQDRNYYYKPDVTGGDRLEIANKNICEQKDGWWMDSDMKGPTLVAINTKVGFRSENIQDCRNDYQPLVLNENLLLVSCTGRLIAGKIGEIGSKLIMTDDKTQCDAVFPIEDNKYRLICRTTNDSGKQIYYRDFDQTTLQLSPKALINLGIDASITLNRSIRI